MRPPVVLILLTLAGAALAAETLPHRVEDAVQDGQGVVWGYRWGGHDALLVFQNGKWDTRRSPLGELKADPVKLTRLPNGAVAGLWRIGKERLSVTWHLGEKWEAVAETPGTVPNSNVFTLGDSQNRLWITGYGPEVRRAGKGNPFFSYSIPAEATRNPGGRWAPVQAVEDGQGRVWAWSNAYRGGTTSTQIRGVLIFTGDQAERRDLGGLSPEQTFSVLARKDQRHLWVGVLDDGLYEVDIDTLQARRVPPPEENALVRIEAILPLGRDLYVSTRQRNEQALWRRRDGEWRRLMGDFDLHCLADRKFFPCEKGVIVEAIPSPWFVGRDASVARLDWQTGLDLDFPRTLLQCRDGKWLAVGRDNQFFYGKLQLPPPRTTKPGRVTPQGLRHGWVFDPAGDLWMVPEAKEKPVLRAFRAGQWQEYPLPEKSAPQDFGSIVADHVGRIWLLPNSTGVKAACFDPAQGQWREMPKYETALEAFRADPPRFFNPGSWNYVPQFSADGQRITFRSGEMELAYFDGNSWMRWKQPQIVPAEAQNRYPMGVPFFDASGKLCVTMQKHTWQLEGGQWKETAFEVRFPTDVYSGGFWRNPSPSALPGCVTQSPASSVWDNQGAAWLMWHNALYKWRDGKCVKVFSDTERNPFTMRRTVLDAWVDPSGCAYLKTNSSTTEVFRIQPKSAPPRTKIILKPISEDSVRADFQAGSLAKISFRWRLDAGPWQWTEQRRIALEWLPNGLHTLQVQATDEELQCDPRPVEAKFEIKVDPQKQLAGFISGLSAPDFERRKVSISALARQPEAAVAALKIARESADDDLCWWIDAALERIEAERHSSSR